MKINFKNVSETLISGEPAIFYQAFGNVIFNNTMDRKQADWAKEIYAGRTLDLTEEEINQIAEFIEFKSAEGVYALVPFARRGLAEYVNAILNGMEHVEPPEEVIEEEEVIIPTEE